VFNGSTFDFQSKGGGSNPPRHLIFYFITIWTCSYMKLSKRRLSSLVDISMVSLSKKEMNSQARHISFLLKRNRVVGWGVNKVNKTHPLAQKLGHRFASIHSELDVILNTNNIISHKGLTLVNIRLSTLSFKYDKPIFRLSKPCRNCQKLILSTPSISSIYYSTRDGEFEQLI